MSAHGVHEQVRRKVLASLVVRQWPRGLRVGWLCGCHLEDWPLNCAMDWLLGDVADTIRQTE